MNFLAMNNPFRYNEEQAFPVFCDRHSHKRLIFHENFNDQS